MIRQRPRRDPKFHQAEMFDGAGRSITALFIILMRGWVVRSVAIKKSVERRS